MEEREEEEREEEARKRNREEKERDGEERTLYHNDSHGESDEYTTHSMPFTIALASLSIHISSCTCSSPHGPQHHLLQHTHTLDLGTIQEEMIRKKRSRRKESKRKKRRREDEKI